APKPPAYPFIKQQIQRAGTQKKQRAEHSSATTALPPVLSCHDLCHGDLTFLQRACAPPSASVKGLLRPGTGACKRKMTAA
ncbi:MAG: hypothetical protein V4516_06260, partial [Pseudomonadota bacterium]